MECFAVSASGVAGTEALARRLAPALRPADVVLLKGGLATGKTTFVKAVVAALGSSAPVTSPTFTLAHFYKASPATVLHVDAYRLTGIHEYRDLGLAEYTGESITLVEWGEKVAEDFGCHLLAEFECDASAPERRRITFSSACDRWEPVIRGLRQEMVAGTGARGAGR